MAHASPWLFRLPSRGALLALFLAAGVVAGSLSLALGQSLNLDVFRAAAAALLRGDDLYALHARDYFKYSPSFALLFVPLAWLPAAVAAPLWSTLNFLVAFRGIDRAVAAERDKRLALAWALGGILLTTDGDQSNLLVVGLLLLALDAMEKDRPWTGACLLAVGAHVKVFPLLGAVFALFRPRPLRGLAAIAIATLAMGALPLATGTCGPRALAAQYVSWWHLLSADHANAGWSAMNMLQEGLGIGVRNGALQVVGLALQSIPIVLGLRYAPDAAWRRTLAASLLAFAVLFNHRAEYASYVISAVAVALWMADEARPAGAAMALLAVLALVAPGPLFARSEPSVHGFWAPVAAHRLFHPLRVAPLFAVWLLMLRSLISRFVTVRVSIRLAPRVHAS
jgi:hypothetical protein